MNHTAKTLLLFITLITLGVATPAFANNCVILLHGLARSEKSMHTMEKHLRQAGYNVVNSGYPSTSATVENLAASALPLAINNCNQPVKAEHVFFVTHSMGGIMLRQYLSANTIDNLKRVVMLGPPNKGSQVVDHLKSVPGFKAFNGPAGQQLGTDANSLPLKLGPANFEVGIIAGTFSINLLLSTLLPNPDDGKVSVENTRLEGMKDHLEVPVSHPFLMSNLKVIEHTLHFLQHGFFKRDENSTAKAKEMP